MGIVEYTSNVNSTHVYHALVYHHESLAQASNANESNYIESCISIQCKWHPRPALVVHKTDILHSLRTYQVCP
jgi:hypothetical protein